MAAPQTPAEAVAIHVSSVNSPRSDPIDWKEGIELMRQVGGYDGQRAALSIIYFASDSDSAEGDDALMETDAAIREQWEAKGV